MPRYLIAMLSLVLWHAPVSAEDYSWYLINARALGNFPSPVAACQAYVTNNTYGGKPIKYSSVSWVSETSFSCLFLALNSANQEFTSRDGLK